MLLNLEGFQYITSMDLKTGYYHTRLSNQSIYLCTIIITFESTNIKGCQWAYVTHQTFPGEDEQNVL